MGNYGVKFWTALVGKAGDIYHMGTTTNIVSICSKFDLPLDFSDFTQVSINPKKEFGYLRPINKENWKFKFHTDKREWWIPRYEEKCWQTFRKWMDSEHGDIFKNQLVSLTKWCSNMESKNGEEYIYATKITNKIKKLLNIFYKKSDVLCNIVHDDDIENHFNYSVWEEILKPFFDKITVNIWESIEGGIMDVNDCFNFNGDWVAYEWYPTWWGMMPQIGRIIGCKDSEKLKVMEDILQSGVFLGFRYYDDTEKATYVSTNEMWVFGKEGSLLDIIQIT